MAYLWLALALSAEAATVNVQVKNNVFTPATVSVQPGDTVRWTWIEGGHTVTSGNPSTCTADGSFDTGLQSSPGFTFSRTFTQTGQVPYFCSTHCSIGMAGMVNVSGGGSPPPPTSKRGVKQVIIPADDRFTPMSLTVRVGDKVQWVNQDTDDHTVVSSDVFNTVGKKLTGINQVVKGTTSNGGQPGTFQLRFTRPGTFVYHCRIHSHVDSFNQPVAPGPGEDPANPTASGIQGNDGGIPGTPPGNFGTPMMGVITVVPH